MTLKAALQVPVGWKKCVACSDYKRKPGQMWLGYTKTGADEFVACPVCNGSGELIRFKYVDPISGSELREI